MPICSGYAKFGKLEDGGVVSASAQTSQSESSATAAAASDGGTFRPGTRSTQYTHVKQ